VLRVREQARQEREAQQRRREEIMKEMEERKARIRNDKRRLINISEIRSKRREKEIEKLRVEFKGERNVRSEQINEQKIR
jgi:hypothetical protein